jgi:hypothetical protein
MLSLSRAKNIRQTVVNLQTKHCVPMPEAGSVESIQSGIGRITVEGKMESKDVKEPDHQDTEQEKRHVEEVVRVAHSELRDLLRRRAEIMQRIGSVKRTILGLASVFGKVAPDEEWMELKGRRRNSDQPGFTKTCRMILMEAEGPLTAREVCERVKDRIEQIDLRHKDPLASVTTVLNRLAEYGEARIVLGDNGRRSWQWISEAGVTPERKVAEKIPTQKLSPPNST